MSALTSLALVLIAQSKPLITLSNVPVQDRQLSALDVQTDAQIELTWHADLNAFQTYRYEITYDRPRDVENNVDAELVVLDDTPDSGKNIGVVVSGQVYTLRIRPSQIVRDEDLPENDPPTDFDDQPEQRSIVVQVFIPGQEGDEMTATSQSWPFEYDTRPPPAPVLRELFPGENHIDVSWRVATGTSSEDVESWEVVYCADGSAASITATSSTGDDIQELPCPESERHIQKASPVTQLDASISDSVKNGIPVAVAVRAIDEFGNAGRLSNAKLQTPAETTDFWELYKGLGGEEDGGFCFVATAAHGSYAHPVVKLLRAFRDRVLKTSYAGTGLVWAYYHWSPPAAEALRHDRAASSYARIALLPIAMFAFVWTVLPFLGALALAFVAVRRLGKKAVLIGALVLLAPSIAQAETRPDPTGWLGFGVEFKGGPYLPDMGRPSQSGGDPAFETVFSRQGSNALFQLAFDLQLFRAFGTAGVGGSFGFMQWVGKGVFGENLSTKSRDTTVFNILPLTLVGFYRFDWLADNSPVPLVPYVRGGLAYYIWWVTNSNGHVSRLRGDTSTSEDDLLGRGGKFGVTGTAGIALMLNHLEPNAAVSLYNATGIRGSYLFVEVEAAKVDGFGGDGFDLSEVNWALGIYLEF
jgi:hypothetical protein